MRFLFAVNPNEMASAVIMHAVFALHSLFKKQ